MIYHMIAFVVGFILDLIVGDPYSLPHPIRWIGKLISFLEGKLLKEDMEPRVKRRNGRLFAFLVCFIVEVCVIAILVLGYLIHPILGCVIESIMTYQMLATKCLKVESMKVYDKLKNGTIEDARYAVSMIVGRDTQNLDDTQVAKAAVETVAENTSDGIIAPMLYLALGGPIYGFLYKTINTMDSMVGYKNDKFMDFGRAAAKLDDVVNFYPARISALFMILSCAFLGKDYSVKNAFRIFKRDRYKHASPNSAQTEAVCAGALGIQLAGDASYFGKVLKKPFIGDATRPVEAMDIVRANRMLYGTAIICEVICVAILVFFTFCL